MIKSDLPQDLRAVIGEEAVDFAVYAKNMEPRAKSYGVIGFALMWLVLPLFASYVFFKPLFAGEDVNFKVDDIPTTANWDNLEPLIFPAGFLLLFLAIGFGMLFWGLVTIFKKGGYYVGTETRIIHYRKGKIQYFDWEQFTGNAEMHYKKQYLSLELRRGKYRKRENRGDEFVPESLHLAGIENLLKIERICRERIKQNDPTPALNVKTAV